MSNITILRNTKKATKKDLCVTLSYFQDALEVAQKLKSKLDNMPLMVRHILEDYGSNLNAGIEAEFMFKASINYLESLIECMPQD